jgi:hypothetical protein
MARMAQYNGHRRADKEAPSPCRSVHPRLNLVSLPRQIYKATTDGPASALPLHGAASSACSLTPSRC